MDLFSVLFSDSDTEEDFYMMDYENTTQSELKCLTICSITTLFEDHLLLKTSDEWNSIQVSRKTLNYA